ncbi:MAG: dihydroorotase [Flavobacteriaceae bacterium]|nr:dihydroorotase [Flavobacteriaceae bacterium]
MNILLKSAKIIDQQSPYHLQTCDVLIKNGVIVKIASTIKDDDCEEIKLENLHISQGWLDTSVSFGEPGYEERETIENGLKVASKSGFTAVMVNPNTNPIADNQSIISFIKSKANNSAIDLYPIGAFTKKSEGLDLAELYDMKNAGAVAFADYKKSISNPNLLKIGLQYAQNFDGLVMSFPQNNDIAQNGLVNEEENSTRLGLKGIPALAEELQIARDLFILEYTGGKLHIPTISTKKSVDLIREAKAKGLSVTCSVTVHNLVLTDDELHRFDSNTKVLPPLRTKEDNQALIDGVKDGTIDCITSDHNPIDIEHKKVEYAYAKFGTIGLESFFGAVNSVLDLPTTISCLTEKPKHIFGIPQTPIKEGEKASITLFNPDGISVFSKEKIFSTSENSIFLNKKGKGNVYGVISNGKVVL